MRIAFLVNGFPRLSETFILNQVVGLIDRGHQVDIYADCIEDWSVVHPDVECYRLWERTYAMQKTPKNYLWRVLKGIGLLLRNFHRAPRLMARSLNVLAYGEQALNLWLLYAAVSLLDRPRDYDIIHCQFGTQGYRGLAFKRLLASPARLVVMFRGHDISCYVRQGGDRVYRHLFHKADYFLANCDFFRQRAIALGCDPEKIAVHRSGLDPQKFPFQSRQWPTSGVVEIATIGRLVEKKGIEYAIRAVAERAKSQNLVLRIIGDGELRPTLEALIRELGATDCIHLEGWQDESAIIKLLARAHLFIAPSVTAADGNQDAPINTLKEAMAMGLPVLSTHHGGIPELVQDGVSGYLVPERDATALAQKLGEMLAERDNWPTMAQAGRAFVERHYNIGTLNNRLVAFYRYLLGWEAPPTEDWPTNLQISASLMQP